MMKIIEYEEDRGRKSREEEERRGKRRKIR